QLVQHLEAAGPKALIESEPRMRARERPRREAAQMRAAAHLAADQSGVLECLDVLRGRRERHREGLGKLAHRSFAAGEVAQHPPACGIAESMKDRIELGCFQFNHVVEYRSTPSKSQPIG